ncbi:T9SS type B sorting domain-containing protein [Winogradskyella psychrotolerans]|uniref:T9SS type B sorting domain-containing protein n=1 Tax=Winogradskyella psychrotolerans TaxID=1344585 RepID=UPI00209159A5|nr:T9SS type B sorting domain-containing protein [Winogradskyella psychrotolerans]
MKNLQRLTLLILFLNWNHYSNAQITLSHNIGTTPIETDMFSCEDFETWSRIFNLADFGIAANEQFIIRSGQVAFSQSSDGAILEFRVMNIDDNFHLLGRRGIGQSPIINGAPEIIQTDFENPIIVPAGTERILVTVQKTVEIYNPASAEVYIAGTANDTGVSYYSGCQDNFGITPTTNLTTPVPNANFYINVTGDVLNIQSSGSTTRLSHNVCDDIIQTDIHSCSSSYIYWARTFTLANFGISTNEEFVITSGQVGINNVGWSPEISFNIYEIDDNFPDSFSETNLIGSSQYQQLNAVINDDSEIIQIDFNTPVVIPADVERILVEVHKGIAYGSALAFISGSTYDNDLSWQRGCTNLAGGPSYGSDEYVSTVDLGRPDANFYINVTGNVNHLTNNYSMNISNICSEFLKEFSIENDTNITSVIWDFGDPASGIENTSLDTSPFHDFSEDGIYTITATVTTNNGSVETLSETIDVNEPPTAYAINNIYACEDVFDSGISSSIDVSMITQQVLGGQTDKIITYIDGSYNEYTQLPNPFTNTIRDIETIIVRVAHEDTPCCYSEASFDIIVLPSPQINDVEDLISCSETSNGYSTFDISNIPNTIINGQPDVTVELFDSQNISISTSDYSSFTNLTPQQDYITAVLTNSVTGCYSEKTITILVNENPIANQLQILYGCDDNNDGFSEYFETSNIENQVLGAQSGMSITYYTENGFELLSPLPNPLTNTEPFNQNITVRVTDTGTRCYAETVLQLQTITQPNISQPLNLYACDQGDGYSEFDTSDIETQLIGNQTGLTVLYFDTNGNSLPSPLPALLQNTNPFSQTINVTVEDSSNPLCYSETSFNLIVNPLPEVDLEDTYTLCDLEPHLNLSVPNNFNAYTWTYEDGTIISTSYNALVIDEGQYTLTITKLENGISCENTYSFYLIRSELPEIEDVKYGELGNNFIEIIASGDGNFEYSIDEINYQDSNYFPNVTGGTYTVYVREKEGCGADSQNVTIIDYPKFFTPNHDTKNDYWQIKGINNYPNAKVLIYNRYGKLLTQLSANESGWDGTYNRKALPTSDYWFIAHLGNGKTFTGHFSLKR